MLQKEKVLENKILIENTKNSLYQIEEDNTQKAILEEYSVNLNLIKESDLIEIHNFFDYITSLVSNKIGLHSKRVAQLCSIFGKHQKLDNSRLKDLYYAGLYHDIGKLFELASQGDHSEIGANILNKIGNFKNSAEMIRKHHKTIAENISTDVQILNICDQFDKIVHTKNELDDEKKPNLIDFFNELNKNINIHFSNELFNDFKHMILDDFKYNIITKEIKLGLIDLEDKMTLSRPVFTESGKMLLNSDFVITKDIIIRLFNHNKINKIKIPIYVYEKNPEKLFNINDIIKM